jgi:hypothetical protein
LQYPEDLGVGRANRTELEVKLKLASFDMTTSSSSGLNLKLDPKYVGTNLETKLHHLRHR